MPPVSAVDQLADLNRRIEFLEEQANALEKRLSELKRPAGRLGRQFAYLQAATWFRKPISSFDLWPAAALILTPLVCGIFGFMLVDLVFASFAARMLGFVIGAAAGAAGAAALLYLPDSAALPQLHAAATSQRDSALAEVRDTASELADVHRELRELRSERRQLVASDKLERAMLLQRDWKNMQPEEWEDYLVEVCRTLGAKVERTDQVTDRGVDLLVTQGGRRIAVLAKVNYHVVNVRAVQDAARGQADHRCDAAAVITNRQLTAGAKESAANSGCRLIGIDEFPQFVLGEIEL